MGVWYWLAFVRDELALFAAFFFLLGAIDEIAVDALYGWLRLTGKRRTVRVDETGLSARPLAGKCAVFIPAWRESGVIGATIAHTLAAWSNEELWLFVGCYRNDPETRAAAQMAVCDDPRVKIVICQVDGPTCKADCLNHLFDALRHREAEDGDRVRMVVLHDAEDMVDPAALAILDRALDECEFAQLPVLALPQAHSRWIAGHYSDEFAEAHAKTMVVRDAVGSAIPGAGVGCAIARDLLDRLDRERSGRGPFATGALTEDYELGLTIGKVGGRGRFVRMRTSDGRLIATRAFFPSDLKSAIRQKTRWTHGIALQGWDRLGWTGGPIELWMQLRDRRGPLAALLLAIAYLLILAGGIELVLRLAGLSAAGAMTRELRVLLLLNLLALVWRAGVRAIFTAREFGLVQGLLAIPRIVVSNTIAILAGRRAVLAYLRSLRGAPFAWDKTEHFGHPSITPSAKSSS